MLLIQVWDAYMDSIGKRLRDETMNGHYWAVRQMIWNYADQGRVAWSETGWFVALASRYSSRTFNERRRMLCACLVWAIETGLVSGANPYRAVPSMRRARPIIQPFSADEVQRILKAFSTNQFVHPNSKYSHDHYVVFVLFLFTYGSRLGEARALTWQQIDWDRNLIRIDRAMGRDTAMGPYRTRPVVKQTKTGEVNWLPLMPTIRAALEKLYQEPCAKAKFWGLEQVTPKPSDLVFPGHRGGALDIRRFRITWKAVLEGLHIPYRYPYQCRHTVLSQMATEHGLTAAAAIAGQKGKLWKH